MGHSPRYLRAALAGCAGDACLRGASQRCADVALCRCAAEAGAALKPAEVKLGKVLSQFHCVEALYPVQLALQACSPSTNAGRNGG